MPGKAAKIVVTEVPQDIFMTLRDPRTSPKHLAQRAEIVLLGFEKHTHEEIAGRVGLERHQVGTWRRWWRDDWDRLLEFIDYFNRVFAKPFTWKYTGRPLQTTSTTQPTTTYDLVATCLELAVASRSSISTRQVRWRCDHSHRVGVRVCESAELL